MQHDIPSTAQRGRKGWLRGDDYDHDHDNNNNNNNTTGMASRAVISALGGGMAKPSSSSPPTRTAHLIRKLDKHLRSNQPEAGKQKVSFCLPPGTSWSHIVLSTPLMGGVSMQR
ncbi:hypothetical protein LZ31DRAFT_293029 [Colletotrichum somersetense]|nr:hypothetical protein LZ31DRAFT_293029 [Colletotrichum somersetense]